MSGCAVLKPQAVSSLTGVSGGFACRNWKAPECRDEARSRHGRSGASVANTTHAHAAGAITPAQFLTHLASCAQQYPIIREAPAERVVATGLHESGLHPLAIHDNPTGRSYFPDTVEQAIALATSLHEAGHRIDAGIMQVTQANWPAYGLTLETVFDPRANICAGARILGEAYVIERRVACRYNTGRPDCTNGYPESIDRAAAALRSARPAG